MTKLFLLVSLLLCSLFTHARIYNILDFGAENDTTVLSTQAIQMAIDECHSNNGGKVLVPAGNYLIGTIILKSNVQLEIEEGATLFGSRNIADYIKIKAEFISLRTQEETIQLIYAEKADNISLTGMGEIDGQGKYFPKISWMDEGITRPHLLRFINCSNIKVKDLSLKNSGCWMQHYLACSNLQVDGLRIDNHNNYNNDGIDIDGCKNVTISNVISDTDDDGIVLKSTSASICENVSITNCVVSSHCNALKLGTETNGGFRNIVINNCVVKPSRKDTSNFFGQLKGIGGIVLLIVDGGIMDGVSISTIQIEGTESPIFIRLANRARPFKKGDTVYNIGNIRNVSIDNIQAVTSSPVGCSITGMPNRKVEDIQLSNISIQYPGGGADTLVNRTIDEKEKDYPEATMFGALPAYGFYVRHAKGISFNNVKLITENNDARPAFHLNDVDLASFSDCMLSGTFTLENTNRIFITNTRLTQSAETFINIEGNENSKLILRNNQSGKAKLNFENKNIEVDEQGNF